MVSRNKKLVIYFLVIKIVGDWYKDRKMKPREKNGGPLRERPIYR